VEFYDGNGAGEVLIHTVHPGDDVETLHVITTSTVMTIRIISTGDFELSGGIYGTYEVRDAACSGGVFASFSLIQGDWCSAAVNCSGHGSCATGGFCICDVGYGGDACQTRYVCGSSVARETFVHGEVSLFDTVRNRFCCGTLQLHWL